MEVLSHIFKKSIESSDAFSRNEDLVEYIIPMLEMKVFLPEDMIIRQGEEGREMYFIATGDCIVLVKDTHRREKAVRKLGRGDPDLDTSLEILKAIPEAGADFIELGMPFTDPVADGVSVQFAGQRALAAGSTLTKVIDMVREFRKVNDHTPIT